MNVKNKLNDMARIPMVSFYICLRPGEEEDHDKICGLIDLGGWERGYFNPAIHPEEAKWSTKIGDLVLFKERGNSVFSRNSPDHFQTSIFRMYLLKRVLRKISDFYGPLNAKSGNLYLFKRKTISRSGFWLDPRFAFKGRDGEYVGHLFPFPGDPWFGDDPDYDFCAVVFHDES